MHLKIKKKSDQLIKEFKHKQLKEKIKQRKKKKKYKMKFNVALAFLLLITLSHCNGFQIFVKTLTGRQYIINCESSDTILSIKQKIQQKEGLPPQKQTLIFQGQQLAEEQTLESYNIVDQSSLNIILHIRFEKCEKK